MSDALLCEDQHLKRDVIIKTLSPGTDQRRIMDELAALQAIRSKHVVQVYDVIRDRTGAVLAIVEEYLPGDDLTAIAPPTDENTFLSLLYQIAEGIRDIHDQKIIHRDIKRQNMKFDAEECLKIFDFGLARDEKFGATTMGEVGTPGYMAPELYEATAGGHVHFTMAIDTFAFGATAVALALGKLPGDMRRNPPKLPCHGADFTRLSFVPKEIALSLNACLDPRPSLRPTMRDVADLIGRHLLRDQHRALLVSGGSTFFLNRTNRTVQLSVRGQGSLKIYYDGLSFVVSEITGHVSINNMEAVDGQILPGSCVIVLGSAALAAQRTYITVDVSHPEVGI